MQIQKEISEFTRKGPPPWLSSGASVQDALDAMRDNSSSCVLVINQGVLVGIFTARDFLNRVAAQGRSAPGTKLSEVMTRDPVTMRPDDDITFAVNKMAMGGYRNVPIMNGEEPVGVLTVREIVSHLVDILQEVEQDAGNDAMWLDIGGG